MSFQDSMKTHIPFDHILFLRSVDVYARAVQFQSWYFCWYCWFYTDSKSAHCVSVCAAAVNAEVHFIVSKIERIKFRLKEQKMIVYTHTHTHTHQNGYNCDDKIVSAFKWNEAV